MPAVPEVLERSSRDDSCQQISQIVRQKETQETVTD
jgi:hypothetical protein